VRPFVFAGDEKIPVPGPGKTAFFYRAAAATRREDFVRACGEFFRRQAGRWRGRTVAVILPDDTRAFQPHVVLAPLLRNLRKYCRRADVFIALGLHRRVPRRCLRAWLGSGGLRRHAVFQHDPRRAESRGTVQGVPCSLHRRLADYDLLFTVGLVEPHLYAGFSGGVKGIAIGLAGEETILATHAVSFLSRPGVRMGQVRGNPFQRYLWGVRRKLPQPVWSLNLVNDTEKRLAGFWFGEARAAYRAAVRRARRLYTFRVRRPFDVAYLGCEAPKHRSLYQVSRLFNYALDKKPLVRPGGAVVVFARLDPRNKSAAEKNFERLLKKPALPARYAYSRPGEHRAFKVLQAAQRIRLAVVTPRIPPGRWSGLRFFSRPEEAAGWIRRRYGPRARRGVIPAGFVFLPA